MVLRTAALFREPHRLLLITAGALAFSGGIFAICAVLLSFVEPRSSFTFSGIYSAAGAQVEIYINDDRDRVHRTAVNHSGQHHVILRDLGSVIKQIRIDPGKYASGLQIADPELMLTAKSLTRRLDLLREAVHVESFQVEGWGTDQLVLAGPEARLIFDVDWDLRPPMGTIARGVLDGLVLVRQIAAAVIVIALSSIVVLCASWGVFRRRARRHEIHGAGAAGRNSFNTIRLCAALMVVLSHIQYPFFGNELEWLQRVYLKYESLGGLGVGIFFAVSGFLITDSLLRDRRPGSYARKRAARLLPGLAMFVATCLLASLLSTSRSIVDFLSSTEFLGFVLNVAIFPNNVCPGPILSPYVYSCNIAGHLWTLTYEVICYVAIFILLTLIKPSRLLVTMTGAVLTGTVAYIWVSMLPAQTLQLSVHEIIIFKVDSRHAVQLLTLFCSGALLRIAPEWMLDARVGVGALLIFLLSPLVGSRSVFGAAELIALPLATIFIARRFADPPGMERLGDPSYGIYLYHWPIQAFIWVYLGAMLGGLGAAGASILLTGVVGLLSFHFVEQPTMRAARQGTPNRVLHSSVPILSPQ